MNHRLLVVSVFVVSLVVGSVPTAAPAAVDPICPPRCEVVLTSYPPVDPAAQTPALTGGGKWVVFLGPSSPGSGNALWSVAVDGSAGPVRLASGAAGTAGVVSFHVASDSDRIVHIAEVEPGIFEIGSSVAGDPSSLQRLSPDLEDHTADAFGGPGGGAIALTSDGLVLFRMIPLFLAPSSLWAVPIDGTEPATRLSGSLHAWDFRVTPRGESVVFRAAETEDGRVALYSAHLSPTEAPVRISSPGVGGVELARHVPVISADGAWVAFLGDFEQPGRLDLVAAPIGEEGGQRLIAVGRPLNEDGGEQGIQLVEHASAAGANVVFKNDPDIPGVFQLFSSPFAASEAPLGLSLAAPATGGEGSVWYFETVAPDRVVYFGDLDSVDRLEMYSAQVDIAGSQVKLSASEVPAGGESWVGLPFVSPDGARIAYMGLLSGTTPELYTAPLDREGEQVRISTTAPGAGQVEYFVFTPDGSRIVYTGGLVTADATSLFSALADGNGLQVQLAEPAVDGGAVGFGPVAVQPTPDGDWVLFTGDLERDGVVELFVVPVDGSTAAVKVSRRTMVVGTTAQIVDTSACGAVFVHNRLRPKWNQLSVVTVPGCLG